ncbi:hypothetical protein [Crenobacter caeni]|uniref:Uncharacterized protein n=1 Tax=Crenobacter caeni TaxID=2705474 RepID=A0A6B2KRD8_9NEIS|nr:hypothetical protein [Crenobacter caeni]NDV12487.1 hypothetical protein [Crenobacter caeni]
MNAPDIINQLDAVRGQIEAVRTDAHNLRALLERIASAEIEAEINTEHGYALVAVTKLMTCIVDDLNQAIDDASTYKRAKRMEAAA